VGFFYGDEDIMDKKTLLRIARNFLKIELKKREL
jgi:hypothetical protein